MSAFMTELRRLYAEHRAIADRRELTDADLSYLMRDLATDFHRLSYRIERQRERQKTLSRTWTKDISIPATCRRPFEIKGLSADGSEFEAYASTWHVKPDRQNDVIEKGAFSRSIRERPEVPLLWAHLHWEHIGKCTGLNEDQYGLRFKAKISDTTRGRDAKILLKDGAADAFSIGFRIDDYDHRQDGVRVLKRISLYEVSIVPVPADTTARLIQ